MNKSAPWKPRQISPKGKKGSIRIQSANPLCVRPQCAAKVGEIIASYAAAERFIVEMMAYLIQAEDWVAAEMFHEIRKLHARIGILNSVLKKKLGSEFAAKAYSDVLEPLKDMQGVRDRLAHGYYLIRTDYPDDLVLIDGWGKNQKHYLFDMETLSACALEMNNRAGATQRLLMNVIAASPPKYASGAIVLAGQPNHQPYSPPDE